jgi:UDP-galactopyranose mutase
VGAGFSGAVLARELAEYGFSVKVIDKRGHVGGNAFDYVNEIGLRVHQYGPHLFHTSNMKVVDWLSRFTEWTPYQHKVKAQLRDGRLVTLPVNRETRDIVGEAHVLDIFFRPYSKKMWGIDLEELDPEILQRVPIRDDLNELYFPNDQFQALPSAGYTKTFEKILDHPNIDLQLLTTFDRRSEPDFLHVFNSMPIDEYFDYALGRLPYRSVKFHHFNLPIPRIYPVASVNFTHDEPFTRVTEWKNLPGHGSNNAFTTLTIEEPCDYADNQFERFYPVKDISGKNIELYKAYKSLTRDNMTFIGRCGMYAYLDMHQAISSALAISRAFLAQRP